MRELLGFLVRGNKKTNNKNKPEVHSKIPENLNKKSRIEWQY